MKALKASGSAKRYVVDMNNARFVDSTGLGIMTWHIQKKAESEGIEVEYLLHNDEVADLFVDLNRNLPGTFNCEIPEKSNHIPGIESDYTEIASSRLS